MSPTNPEDDPEGKQTEQSVQTELPTPPSSRPSSQRLRCSSLRGNLRPHTKQKSISQPQLMGNNNDTDGKIFNLQKYKLLPAIGSQDGHNNDVGAVSGDGNFSKIMERNVEALDLAVKLLDGSRHEHCFSSSDTFRDVVQYMMSVASRDALPCQCEFVSCEVPSQIFSDLSVSLRQANIKTRTLLYLREADPG